MIFLVLSLCRLENKSNYNFRCVNKNLNIKILNNFINRDESGVRVPIS